MLWKSPIYRFRIPVAEESDEFKEIVLNVTGSAPPFKEPSENLKEILNEVFSSDSLKNIDSVLEFGAAKLKNIPFILKKGKTVCAVEFEELTKKSATKKNINRCKRYGDKFKSVVFPNPFIGDKKKFDLGLLINVLPVMPIFAERMYVLQLMYDKIKQGKYLLWVAQKEGSYKKIREAGKNDCGDGIWMGSNRYNKTFYKYHQVDDLDEMMALSGFKLIKRFSGGDDARLYEKTKYNLFADMIASKGILKEIPVDKTIKDPVDTKPLIVKKGNKNKAVVPNPKTFSIESLYIDKIKKIPVGPENAEQYHRVVSQAIARIFRGSLRNMEIKQNTHDRIKIIDTVYSNCAEKGFFKTLQNKKDCNYPILEVKNTKGDPENPEINQLNGSLNSNQGHFGILVCRKVANEETVFKRCQTHLPDRIILFLTDEDIIELLEYSRDGNIDEISDFMDKKLRKLLFKSTS